MMMKILEGYIFHCCVGSGKSDDILGRLKDYTRINSTSPGVNVE